MPSTSLAYRTLIRLGVSLVPIVARAGGKIERGAAARNGVVTRLASWAQAHREPDRPLLWLHAPSVGEGLQAEAVLREIRLRQPRWQILYTHFSPSAETLARRLPADVADYLPWDRAEDVSAVLDALRPAAIVFTKADLWLELATQAAERDIAVGLIAARVNPSSARLGWAARAFLGAGYRAVRLAGAASAEDAERLARLGVALECVEVTGDPRFDSVTQRVAETPADSPLLAVGRGGETLVAGSTWGPDERFLLPAFGAVLAARPGARLIIAPHEPTPEHLEAVERQARELGLPTPVRLSAATGPVPLILVDRVGPLATLYGGGIIGYVGGGFGRAGLHSVLEPAAWGIPVLFGPRLEQSGEAGALVAQRGAAVVSQRFPDWLDVDELSTQAGANPLASLWLALLRNPSHREAAGRRARQYVEGGVGAAARNAALVERLMTAQPSPR